MAPGAVATTRPLRHSGGGERGGEPLLVALVEGKGRGVARTADAEERPQEQGWAFGEGRAGLGVRRQEQGPRPAAPAKDPSRLEEDWGGAEWRERGEWICGGREGGGRVSEKLLYHGGAMRSVRSTIDG